MFFLFIVVLQNDKCAHWFMCLSFEISPNELKIKNVINTQSLLRLAPSF